MATQTKKPAFVGRKRELNDILHAIELSRHGKVQTLLFFGLPRIGKTTLLKFATRNLIKDPEIVPLMYDFKRLVTTPEDFGKRFVEEGLYSIQAHIRSLDVGSDALSIIPASLDECMADDRFVHLFNASSDQSRLDTLLVMLSIPAKVTTELGMKPLYIIDNVSELFSLSLFRNMSLAHTHVCRTLFSNSITSILSTSYGVSYDDMLDVDQCPLQNPEYYELGPLTYQESEAFLTARMKHIGPDMKKILVELSSGHPFYLKSIVRLFRGKGTLDDETVNQLFERALKSETTLALFLQSLYDVTLLKARYHGPLKLLIRFLASREGLTQMEIARMLSMSQGALQHYLSELLGFRILYKENRRYYYTDPVFQKWVLLNL
ncbi:hypothetical protein KKH43_05120 [Patescibacteria group bacterium]|nr:hypothetical protein [Patescibacteria group bacterium]